MHLQLISENQQQFISMLNEPVGGDTTQSQAPAQPAGVEAEQAPDQARGQAPPGVTYVQITQQEKEAIERVST